MTTKLLSFLLLNWITNCFDSTSIVCDLIPYTSQFSQNLDYLWGKVFMQNADRYGFLIISPILIIAQIVTLKFYYDNPKIMIKPGLIFCIIVIFEMLLNIHYFMGAVYYTVYDGTLHMPTSFPVFCTVNSIISAFFSILHFIFQLLVPLYIIYILRSTLKNNLKIWNIVYITIFIIAAVFTGLMWYEGILGLNIFGTCGLTFIRFPDISIGVPIAIICIIVIFLLAGIIAIQYFKKHMPNSIGLRKKKRYETRILFIYVVGYSAFGLVQTIITLFLYLNCQQANPKPELFPLTTLFNYICLISCGYIYFIIFKPENTRTAFKKFLRKIFSKKRKATNDLTSQDASTTANYDDIFNFEQVLLQIQQQNNNIDILKISQVVTIVSGIYIAYKQYYNIKEEYYNKILYKTDSSQTMLPLTSNFQDVISKKSIKKIYYHQKMSVKISIQIVKDFIRDLSLLPKLGILQCTMIIHSPKIFQNLLQNDQLQSIFQSFELQQNARKMFNLAEGQGGKSGEFFFYSADNKFVLKTITLDQFTFFDSNLLYFHQHFNRNPDSVLAKIYGLFTFKGDQMQKTYHLILMKNMLACNNSQICRTYDLKGSRYDRQVNRKGSKANELKKMTLKDIDFMKQQGMIHVSKENKQKLSQTIVQDTLFLKNLNLIDYSLLVVKVRWNEVPKNPNFWSRYQRIQSSMNEEEYYHIGIIDYLQQWDLQKKGQKWWKLLMGKKDVSAQQPKFYQNRFATFVGEITQQYCLREQLSKDSQNTQKANYYLGNGNKFQQNLLKLKKLQREGQYISQKVKYLTEKQQSITKKDKQNARQSRVQIEMSISNKINIEIARQKEKIQHQSQESPNSYQQDEVQRPKAESFFEKQSHNQKI